MKKDLYQEVTDRIVEQLENGIIPWHKPWTGIQSGAISGTTGKPYSLLNQMLLRKPGKWYTFLQAKELGGSIRKGEKGSMVVFWKPVAVTEKDKDGNETKKMVPMLRYYTVFHASQIEGLPESEAVSEAFSPVHNLSADATIQNYVTQEHITLDLRKSDEAYYAPLLDRVVLPLMEQFPDTAEFYSTAFHELTHSTGHKSRLDRLTVGARFGKDDEYSREELVAEIGAATLMASHGLESKKTLKNSAAYIQSWLRALKNDKQMIVWAAGRAAKAVDFILSASESSETPEGSGPQEPEAFTPAEAAENNTAAAYALHLDQFTAHYPDDLLRIRHNHGMMEISLDGFFNMINQTKLKKFLSLVCESNDRAALIEKTVCWIRDRIAHSFVAEAISPDTEKKRLQREIQRYQKFEALCLKYA